MCDFGEGGSVPRVIAPESSITDDLDTEVSGIDSSVLNGLTQSMAIFVDGQTILYLGYSDSSGHYLSKVDFFIILMRNICAFTLYNFSSDSIISMDKCLK